MIKIKKGVNGETKFKVRCSRYLYTLVVKEQAKADKLRKTLPPGIKTVELSILAKVQPMADWEVPDQINPAMAAQ